MFQNRKAKKSNVLKGSAAALAAVFSLSLIPSTAINVSADYVGGGIGSEAIVSLNNVSTATKGDQNGYEIRAAYFGTQSQIPIGLTEDDAYEGYYSISYGDQGTISAITSEVTVTYKNSNQVIEIEKNSDAAIKDQLSSDDPASAVYGTVVFDSAGEYVIEYSIDITTSQGIQKHFSTQYSVYSEISGAYFEFDENEQNILPSIYDINLVKTNNSGALKDLALPLPTVYNENEVAQDVQFFSGTDISGVTGDYVVISVSGGNPVAVQEDKGSFYIPSNYFNPDDALYAGTGIFTIRYAYYTQNGTFVSSIERQYRVEESYYEDYDYVLSASPSQLSAVTGVEINLPEITAVTSDETNHAGEEVAIRIENVVAELESSNGWIVQEGAIADGKFTPPVDGNYRLTFTVSDFYGNQTKTIDVFAEGVEDTQNPVAIIYDAADEANYVEGTNDINEYIDASSKLKSKTQTNNVIIYAIGATDNFSSAANMNLVRTIRGSSGRTITIGKEYAAYNLIFDYKFDTLLSNNESLRQQLIAAGIVEESDGPVSADLEETIRAWLLEHNYLFVTSDSSLTIEDGYAYIDASTSSGLMLTGSASGTTYTIRYVATDEAGNISTAISQQMIITNDPTFRDQEAPEITFPTNLKNSYRTNAVITFEAPTASDDTDTNMNITVEYKYVGEDPERYNWIRLDDEYEIHLSEIMGEEYDQDRPVQLIIRATTTDDYGNTGTWTKPIDIIDVQDTEAPTFVYAQYNEATPSGASVEQNSTVTLPTLVFEDDNVDYMNAFVYVNLITEETDPSSEDSTIRVETPITVRGKSENSDALNNTYVLTAGNFVASYAGNYEVKVVVTDAGGNQITMYYYYTAVGTSYVEDPIITGISNTIGDKGTAEVGSAVDLATPSVAYTLGANQAIFGVSDDNSKAATNYTVQVVNDAPIYYVFNENEKDTFTAYEPGVYRLQYNVPVTIYDTTIFQAETDGIYYNGGKVRQASNGDLVIISNDAVIYGVLTDKTDVVGKEYRLYNITANFASSEGKFTYTHASGTYNVRFNDGLQIVNEAGSEIEFAIDASGNVTIGGSAATAGSLVTNLDKSTFKSYNLKSDDILTLTVSDTTAPTMVAEYNYPSIVANTDQKISIQKIEATDLSVRGVDPSKSYVLVSYRGGETSFSTSYYMSTWAEANGYNKVSGNIENYALDREGNYTITYYVYDYSGNLNDDHSYSIAVGDCEAPEINLPTDFVEENYALNSSLTLDFDKIKKAISDNSTDIDALLKTLKIRVVNTSTNKELENTANAEEFRFSYNLDTAGTYRIEISVTDDAGWTTTNDDTQFTVSTDADDGTDVYRIVGTVLIVLAVAVLVGVILYFVISKVKKDKKVKAKNPDAKKKDKK